MAGLDPSPERPAEREAGARGRLAEGQARVVAALVARGEVPAGFDPARMAVQAASLVAKRRAVVARLRPDLREIAGAGYAREFAAYAAARTEPPTGYRADAEDFATWLRKRHPQSRWRRWIRRLSP
ncbi:hypothetical protein ACIBG7_33705 [Nonomuraea sp. NPDC050328]|uniref:hypothetical protein n=1 Tax=Nonomuraea sp. NPDC050328 TaxID=3364361 RepID=UPI0037ACB29A